jgi:hypothetical protein
MAGQLRYLLDVIEHSGAPVTAGALERLQDFKAQVADLDHEKARIEQELIAPINQRAKSRSYPHVVN